MEAGLGRRVLREGQGYWFNWRLNGLEGERTLPEELNMVRIILLQVMCRFIPVVTVRARVRACAVFWAVHRTSGALSEALSAANFRDYISSSKMFYCLLIFLSA